MSVDQRAGLIPVELLRNGAVNAEYAIISALPNPSPGNAPPNPGNIVLTLPLTQARPNGTVVQRQQPPTVRTDRPTAAVVLDVASGGRADSATDGGLANNPAPPAHPPPLPTRSRLLPWRLLLVSSPPG